MLGYQVTGLVLPWPPPLVEPQLTGNGREITALKPASYFPPCAPARGQ